MAETASMIADSEGAFSPAQISLLDKSIGKLNLLVHPTQHAMVKSYHWAIYDSALQQAIKSQPSLTMDVMNSTKIKKYKAYGENNVCPTRTEISDQKLEIKQLESRLTATSNQAARQTIVDDLGESRAELNQLEKINVGG